MLSDLVGGGSSFPLNILKQMISNSLCFCWALAILMSYFVSFNFCPLKYRFRLLTFGILHTEDSFVGKTGVHTHLFVVVPALHCEYSVHVPADLRN